jgi:hypothetical protein
MRVNSANKMIVEDGIFSMMKVNSLMYQSSGDKCVNINDSWCIVNKNWCCLVTDCYKKAPSKVKPEAAPKSGEKYIIWSRKDKQWRFAPTVSGKSKILKASHNLQELIEFKNDYLKGVARG